MDSSVRKNLVTYLAFMFLALAGILYGRQIMADHQLSRVWEIPVLLFLGLGIPFLFLQPAAGLPDFWDKSVSGRQRFLYPALTGAFFGLLDIVVVKVMMHPEPYDSLPPFLQPFPYSLFLYFSGAFEVEVYYRLIPLTIILLLGKWVKGGKYFQAFFWVGAVLTALREPIEQFPDGNPGFVVYAVFTGFAMNFLQAVWYRRSGFLASLSIRLGHYLFWHIILGIYVEYVELVK